MTPTEAALRRALEQAKSELDHPPDATHREVAIRNVQAWKILHKALAAPPQGKDAGEERREFNLLIEAAHDADARAEVLQADRDHWHTQCQKVTADYRTAQARLTKAEGALSRITELTPCDGTMVCICPRHCICGSCAGCIAHRALKEGGT
jgi:phage/plasmid-associated DNA primase